MITYLPHSTSVDNESGIYSGWNDVQLSDLGIRQAKVLSETITSELYDDVYCSDLKRASHTARILFPNSSISFDSRLREMNYGVMNGYHKDRFYGFSQYEKGFDNGEDIHSVESRISRFLLDINRKDRRIAIISHRFPQLAFEVLLNNKSWKEAFETDWRKIGQWKPGWKYL